MAVEAIDGTSHAVCIQVNGQRQYYLSHRSYHCTGRGFQRTHNPRIKRVPGEFGSLFIYRHRDPSEHKSGQKR